MSDDKPYGDSYQNELLRLSALQTRAAEDYTAQMLLIRIGHTGTSRSRREEIAEEAASRWLDLYAAINELNAAEYQRKLAAVSGTASPSTTTPRSTSRTRGTTRW